MKQSKIIEKYEGMKGFRYAEINICGDGCWRGYFHMSDKVTIYTKWNTLELDRKESSSLKTTKK